NLDHGHMRTIGEEDVLWVEDVGLLETWRHAERQILTRVCLARDLDKGNGLCAPLRHQKFEAAAPLEDGTYDLLLNLSAGVRDRCRWAGMPHRAEDPVFVNEIAWPHLQLIGCNLPDFIHHPTGGLIHRRATVGHGSRIEGTSPEWHYLSVT